MLINAAASTAAPASWAPAQAAIDIAPSEWPATVGSGWSGAGPLAAAASTAATSSPKRSSV